jgi:hypothetical protein
MKMANRTTKAIMMILACKWVSSVEHLLLRWCKGFFVLIACFAGTARAEQIVRAGPTEKISQLTGELDRVTMEPTRSRTDTAAGVIGTDLGSSFVHKDRLCFLFGDTFADHRPGRRFAGRCPHPAPGPAGLGRRRRGLAHRVRRIRCAVDGEVPDRRG